MHPTRRHSRRAGDACVRRESFRVNQWNSSNRILLAVVCLFPVVLGVLGGIVMAAEAPEPWPRRYYEEGGGNPFLFYVVYGSFPAQAEPSRLRYRLAGIPEGIDIS